jgi:NAD-dependent SIR2 family protein deacetylase
MQFLLKGCHHVRDNMYFAYRFIKMLEKHKKLLRNYSQNIDTLEQVAGIQNVIECHGKQ